MRWSRFAAAVAAVVLSALVVAVPAAAAPGVQVVGGAPAAAGQFPYQLALLNRAGGIRCGAVLYRPTRAVTSAHCLAGTSPGAVVVRGGSLSHTGGGVLSAVTSFVIHPSYNSATGDHDIAVLRLATALTMTPVTLPAAGLVAPAPGVTLRIAGWGTIGAPSVNLLWGNVTVQPATVCGTLPVFQFCAGSPTVPNACTVDSGGPAVLGSVLRGVISLSSCTRPSGYMDVGRYVAWMISV